MIRYKSTILFFLVVLLAAGYYGYQQAQTALGQSMGTIASEISIALNSTVTIKDIKVSSFNTLTLDEVTVYDRKNEKIAWIPTLDVGFNPLGLLLERTPISAITKLVLHKPDVFIRQGPDGHWNYEDFLPKETNQHAQLRAVAIINDGTAVINSRQGQWQLNKFKGEIDFSDSPTVEFDVSAEHNDAKIRVKGNGVKERLSLRVYADQAEIAVYKALVPEDIAVVNPEGRIHNLFVALNRNNKGELSYAGEVTVDRAAATIRDVDITDASGFFAFNNKELFIYQGQGKIAGQQVAVSGKVNINGPVQQLKLRVAAKQFDAAEFIPTSAVQGALAFSADITGTVENPQINGTVRMPAGSITGYAVNNAVAVVRYQDNILYVDRAGIDIFGGQVSTSGQIAGNSTGYRMSIEGKNLDVGQIPQLTGELSGRANVNITAAGTNLLTPSITGTVTMSAGNWRQLKFTEFNTGFNKFGDNIDLHFVNLNIGAGKVAVSGKISGQNINLTGFGNKIPLADLRPLFPEAELSGTADVTAQVVGTVQHPVANIEFVAGQGRILKQPYQTASGQIILQDSQAALKNVTLENNTTRHTIKGTIGLTGDRPLNLFISSQQARAENISELLLPGENITGNIDNEMHITGTTSNIQAQGHMKLSEGSFRGYLIAQGEGKYIRRDGIIELKEFLITSLNTNLRFSGIIQPNNQLNLDVSAQDIDLSRVYLDLPYAVAGQADFSGKLIGSPQYPVFNGRFTASEIVANGQQLTDIGGQVGLAGKQIEISGFEFSHQQGKYSFAGGINLDNHEMSGRFEAKDGELACLLGLLNIPLEQVVGKLNGEVIVDGRLPKPNIWINGRLLDGKIKNYPLEKIDFDMALVNNVLTVNNFHARQGGGELIMKGVADLNGSLDVEVGAKDIDAGLLTAWLDSTVGINGKLNMVAQVSGTAAAPHAAVSLQINKGQVATADFDDLYGLFIIQNETIAVNQFYIAKGDYRASAYGSIPINALNPKGRRQATAADQMDLKVKLDHADLSILPFLTKEVAWAAGPTQGELTVGGTLMQPSLYGRLEVNDGSVKISSINSPIQKVGVDIQFQGDKINVQAFTGQIGTGSYHLTGSAALNGLAVEDYNLSLSMDKLGIDSKYFKGPLSGQLQFTGNTAKPRLSGNIYLEKNTITIPTIPQLEKSNLDVALDLHFHIGNRVRVYNPLLYDLWLEPGQVSFAGSTQEPDVTGTIRAARGTVSYLRTQFKIQEGFAAFTQYNSFEPVISLQAQTRLVSTLVNLNVKGPLSQMEVHLASEPAMSRQAILSLLTLRSRYFDKQKNSGQVPELGRDDVLSLLDVGLQVRFISEFEETTRDLLGLDAFRFVRTITGDDDDSDQRSYRDREGYSLELSKYVNDRMMLTYTTGINHEDSSVSFQYDLTRRIGLTGSIDNKSNRRLGLEMRFSF